MVIDTRLKDVYKDAMEIIRTHRKYLLKYNETDSLNKEMLNITKVAISTRSKNRRGCCKYNARHESCTIEISEYMLELPREEILNTMLHELLHAFKDSKGHTGTWLWRANYLKEQTGLNIQRARSVEGTDEAIDKVRSRKPWMNTYVCTGCGREVVKSKNSFFGKHPECYRCGACGMASYKKKEDIEKEGIHE